MARRRTISCLLCLLGVVPGLTGTLAGCGNSRTPVPGLGEPAPPNGLRLLALPTAGVLLHVPRSWVVASSPSASTPLLATISSGTAVVALWSYRRAGPLPIGAGALRRARAALVRAARRRDPTLQPIRAAVITLAGRGAVELDAFEHINGQLRRVRSVHVFEPGRELVLDAYAPPALFHSVDHGVFSPVKRSLRLLGSGAA